MVAQPQGQDADFSLILSPQIDGFGIIESGVSGALFENQMTKGKPVINQCVHCKKEDGGPWSGEALLSCMRYVHSECWPEYHRLSKVSQAQMEKLNGVFSKMFR